MPGTRVQRDKMRGHSGRHSQFFPLQNIAPMGAGENTFNTGLFPTYSLTQQTPPPRQWRECGFLTISLRFCFAKKQHHNCDGANPGKRGVRGPPLRRRGLENARGYSAGFFRFPEMPASRSPGVRVSHLFFSRNLRLARTSRVWLGSHVEMYGW